MSQHAPRGVTILVAVILVLVGVAGTFLHLIPSFAGYAGSTWAVIAYVAATVVMLLGVFFRGL
jgi:hypothetical protein